MSAFPESGHSEISKSMISSVCFRQEAVVEIKPDGILATLDAVPVVTHGTAVLTLEFVDCGTSFRGVVKQHLFEVFD